MPIKIYADYRLINGKSIDRSASTN